MSDTLPEVPTHRMTSDEFIAWAMEQEGRYELEDGFVVRLSAERAGHARVKHRVARLLEDAVAHAGLSCDVFPDGMSVVVDGTTTYEPDALVRCGDRTPNDTVRLSDPVIAVEVTSPSTGWRDASSKLAGYFRVPSLRHYVIVSPASRIVVLHTRPAADAPITTRIVPSGPLRLDPPGLEMDAAAFFADL